MYYRKSKAVKGRKKIVRRRPRTFVPKTIVPKYDRQLVIKRGYTQTLTGGGTSQFYGVAWTLSGLKGYTDITNLFAQYRISFVKLKVSLRNELAGASTDTIPRIFVVRDYVDVATPASLDELREYSDVKIKKLSYNRPTVFTIRPATTILQGDGTTKLPQWKQWIPAASSNCEYQGFKMGFDPIPTGQIVDLEWSAWVHGKKLK